MNVSVNIQNEKQDLTVFIHISSKIPFLNFFLCFFFQTFYFKIFSFQLFSLLVLTWKVPDHWTLREAATVPVVYMTVYCAFFMYNPIRKGKKILIHAGIQFLFTQSILKYLNLVMKQKLH